MASDRQFLHATDRYFPIDSVDIDICIGIGRDNELKAITTEFGRNYAHDEIDPPAGIVGAGNIEKAVLAIGEILVAIMGGCAAENPPRLIEITVGSKPQSLRICDDAFHELARAGWMQNQAIGRRYQLVQKMRPFVRQEVRDKGVFDAHAVEINEKDPCLDQSVVPSFCYHDFGHAALFKVTAHV